MGMWVAEIYLLRVKGESFPEEEPFPSIFISPGTTFSVMKTAPTYDPAVGLCLGPYGGSRGEGRFL